MNAILIESQKYLHLMKQIKIATIENQFIKLYWLERNHSRGFEFKSADFIVEPHTLSLSFLEKRFIFSARSHGLVVKGE